MKNSNRKARRAVSSENELDSLVEEPTTPKWEIEIRRILEGERDYAVIHLGSVKSLIEKTIARSHDKPRSRTNFYTALQKVVSTWQPLALVDIESINHLLDFVASYQPPAGRAKLLEFVRRMLNMPPDFESLAFTASQFGDLHRKALVVLSKYYSVTKPANSSFNRKCIELLFSHAQNTRCAGLAIGLLAQLDAVSIDEPRVKHVLEQHNEYFEQAINVLLSSSDRTLLSRQLGRAYAMCLKDTELGAELFTRTLSKRGIKLRPDPGSWFKVDFPSGETLPLESPREDDAIIYKYGTSELWLAHSKRLAEIRSGVRQHA